VCKCSAINVVEPAPPPKESGKPHSPIYTPSILWRPDEPDDVWVIPRLLVRDDDSLNMGIVISYVERLRIEFGGYEGQKLSMLNRVSFYMDPKSNLFTGFGFFYDDGSEESCGSYELDQSIHPRRAPSIEMSFYILGRLGERITCIEVYGYKSDGRREETPLRGLRVTSALISYTLRYSLILVLKLTRGIFSRIPGSDEYGPSELGRNAARSRELTCLRRQLCPRHEISGSTR
jgi:hypothetical protein